MMTTRTRKRVTKVDTTKPSLKIEDGQVIEVPVPVIEEFVIEEDEVEEDNGKPKHRIQTANGEAVYEYVGNCWDCTNEKVDMPVFKCITSPIRADEQMGNQLACGWNDGGTGTPLCQMHYAQRIGKQPKQTTKMYEVIEKRW
jgi:hypothetical protein